MEGKAVREEVLFIVHLLCAKRLAPPSSGLTKASGTDTMIVPVSQMGKLDSKENYADPDSTHGVRGDSSSSVSLTPLLPTFTRHGETGLSAEGSLRQRRTFSARGGSSNRSRRPRRSTFTPRPRASEPKDTVARKQGVRLGEELRKDQCP